MSRIQKPKIRQLIFIELLMALLIGLVIYLLSDLEVIQAYAAGFICFWLPTSFFALRSWQYTGAKYARQVTQAFYAAEMGKFTLSIICFVISFKALALADVKTLFISYMVFFFVHQILVFLWFTGQSTKANIK